ncbi:hypothetical protein LTR10_010608 [Elasticomyces elasticus]|uniref:Uncharacterized protein n=1 Tax=Elasticomyces elasticus TaxID=574655 RepID=A0AAN7VQA2_9PEZI|nr:hypothetical protein LTR27_008715 [Elasticomyces elasticus]KAK4950615.1 hypothetical protein LTR10_010608 [Elasticomyces elasticus]KAK4968214.1 hypothetical protein LTR42_009497 [Elasticomyces elasticus]KAK5682103.1 hypothetical protein LTS10_005228 [Elasticomyces elasticus]KAK5696203.1 hypothetical protein LTR97_008623 [Elasticomyces elasticus]
MSATTETAAAPRKQLEGGKPIKDMTQEEINDLMKSIGYKRYTDLLEEQIRDDIKKKTEDEKSSLKIRIELNLDVEVHLTARVKGDIVIGLL